MSVRPPHRRQHPVVVAHTEERMAGAQLRVADAITGFAGSMRFVYLHAVLSTFVLIGQNRQAAFAVAKANHDFNESELELRTNTELTRQIHTLTTELHRRVVTDAPT